MHVPDIAASVPSVTTALTWRDRAGALRMRLNIARHAYRVEPGLYRVGSPSAVSPVLVTANWKLTFDTLRSNLAGVDAWLLVLDTKGINVWCAAGKGTLSTTEVCRRVIESGLMDVVDHTTLVLPQLAAPGVEAHAVQAITGFRVVYGPVRASDIPAFLATGMRATEHMRRVTFTVAERLALTGVELSVAWRPRTLGMLALVALASGVGRWGFSPDAVISRGGIALLVGFAGLLCGALITPVLLPWLPFRAFAAKGALVGAVAGAVLYALVAPVVGGLAALGAAVAVVTITSFVAMNFTGTSPITSPSGVEREMRRALPFQMAGAAVAAVLWLASAFVGKGF